VDLLAFFRTAEIAAPYPNPTGGHEWYHGTPHHFNDENGQDDDAESAPAGPDRYADEYFQNAGHHWNTDLGSHWSSLKHVAEGFAGGGPEGRVAHARLHLANPKHYDSEYDMSADAIHWAKKSGYRHLPDSREDQEHFLNGDTDKMEGEVRVKPGAYRNTNTVDYQGHMLAGTPSAEKIADIDNESPKTSAKQLRMVHSGGDMDNYLAHHPFREEITAGFKKHLQDQGHDGVIYGNEYESPKGHASAAVFNDDAVNLKKWHYTDSGSPHASHQRVMEAQSPGQLPLLHHHKTPWLSESWTTHDDKFAALQPDVRKPLPIDDKTFYRLHYKPRKWDTSGGASSTPVGFPEGPGTKPRFHRNLTEPGYSSFPNPHELHEYLDSMGWYDNTKGAEHQFSIVQFPGQHVGEGLNHEPLAMPGPRADRVEHTIPEFHQRLQNTPDPRSGWGGTKADQDNSWGEIYSKASDPDVPEEHVHQMVDEHIAKWPHDEDDLRDQVGDAIRHYRKRKVGAQRQFMYHHSPARNRQSIETGGLRPGPAGEEQESGVYLHHDLDAVRDYMGDSHPGQDIYRVDVGGLGLESDPLWQDGSFSRAPIEPHRVSRTAAREPVPSVEDLMGLLGTHAWNAAMKPEKTLGDLGYTDHHSAPGRANPIAHETGEGTHLPTPSPNNPPRKGYYPGEDLAGMDKGPKVAWVKTEHLKAMREYDRRNPAEQTYDSDENIEDHKRTLAEHGQREPVLIAHDPHSDRARLIEGNHRVAAAEEMGWPALAVHVVRAYRHEFDGSQRHVYLGSHKVAPNEHGYTSGELHPRDALPDHMLYSGDAGLRPKTAMGMHGPDYDNLTFEHEEHGRTGVGTEGDPDVKFNVIHAHHPEHGEVGLVSYWSGFHHGPEHINIAGMTTHPEHQRRGVATQLMHEVERRHPGVPINHGDRTQDGGEWAKSMYGHEGEYYDDDDRDYQGDDSSTYYHGGWTLNGQPYVPKESARKTAAVWEHPQPEYVPTPEGASDDEQSKHWDTQRNVRNSWQHETRKALSRGDLTNDQAIAHGYHGIGQDYGEDRVYGPRTLGWKPLPHDLYHVTTDLKGVLTHGLKSRRELGQSYGKGLGGGEDDTISFTDNEELAHHILGSMKEFHDVVNGRKTPAHMWDEAQQGAGAARPFHEEVARAMQSSGGPRHLDAVLHGRTLHQGLHTQAEMDARGDGKWEPHPETDSFKSKDGDLHTVWHRDATPDEKRYHATDMYKSFSLFRQMAGGKPDPMFFSTDTKGFAAMDPSNFGIIKAHPKPKAAGYQVSGMNEWRTADGDALDLTHHKTAAKANPLDGYDVTHLTEGYTPYSGRGPYTRHNLFVEQNDEHVGHLDWGAPDPGSKGKPEIIGVWVDTPHQRKGIATELLRRAREITPDLQHSKLLSPEGEAWKQKVGRWLPHARYEVASEDGYRTAVLSRWLPRARIFEPGHGGLDPRLFNDKKKMKPEVAAVILGDLDAFWTPTYPDWRDWCRVYLAGSEASEWYGNNDFDTLLGVEHKRIRRAHPEFAAMLDEDIDAYLTKGLREHLNDEDWTAPWDGEVWHRTFFVNPNSWDIRDIKPYAAYDITRARWIVEPIHPAADWGPEKLPSAYWDEMDSIISQVHAIEAMPEPMRTGRGAALYDYLHSDRRRAFGPHGTGVYDPGNAVWKALDLHPDRPLAALIDLKRKAANQVAAEATA
jgi:GNAT superfamily N-acetyltransferase